MRPIYYDGVDHVAVSATVRRPMLWMEHLHSSLQTLVNDQVTNLGEYKIRTV